MPITPITKGDNGERSIEAAIEVPGSPEDVWRAIATGNGISSWFVPTSVDERAGGDSVSSFGPCMDCPSKITVWNPPQSYVTETEEGPGKVATEWIVEPRAGGTCVVRVVHRWFADTDDWDGQFEGHTYGWAASFFRMLHLYLAHFAGQKCVAFLLTAFSKSSGPETWRTIKDAMQIDDRSGRINTAPGAPQFVGKAEDLTVTDPDLLRLREKSPHLAAAFEGMEGENPELLVRLEGPCPGFGHVFIMPMGETTMVSVRFHLFGPDARDVASPFRDAWETWLEEKFPSSADDLFG